MYVKKVQVSYINMIILPVSSRVVLRDILDGELPAVPADVDPGVVDDVHHPGGDHAAGGHVLPGDHVAS